MTIPRLRCPDHCAFGLCNLSPTPKAICRQRSKRVNFLFLAGQATGDLFSIGFPSRNGATSSRLLSLLQFTSIFRVKSDNPSVFFNQTIFYLWDVRFQQPPLLTCLMAELLPLKQVNLRLRPMALWSFAWAIQWCFALLCQTKK